MSKKMTRKQLRKIIIKEMKELDVIDESIMGFFGFGKSKKEEERERLEALRKKHAGTLEKLKKGELEPDFRTIDPKQSHKHSHELKHMSDETDKMMSDLEDISPEYAREQKIKRLQAMLRAKKLRRQERGF